MIMSRQDAGGPEETYNTAGNTSSFSNVSVTCLWSLPGRR
jgi:hypothetical protein